MDILFDLSFKRERNYNKTAMKIKYSPNVMAQLILFIICSHSFNLRKENCEESLMEDVEMNKNKDAMIEMKEFDIMISDNCEDEEKSKKKIKKNKKSKNADTSYRHVRASSIWKRVKKHGE